MRGGGGGSTKIAKINGRILTFDLFTARSSLLPYAFVLEKPLKFFFSKTEDALWLNPCIYHRKREVYESCLNNGRTLTFDLFYGEDGKNVQNFKLLLWSLWASFVQISYGASLGWGNEKLLK